VVSSFFFSKSSGRLDKLLSLEIKKSRNQVDKLIKDGLVSIDGNVVRKASFQ